MPIEPFEITTVYPDGRKETRMSTPEEVAQREADLAQFELDQLARIDAANRQAEKVASARAKFEALGLEPDEIDAVLGIS